ncbi:MAG: hypothetical protein LBO67_00490, partial [Spirochaetaceae bacterium]|nr:hypothetical protein [Spirochaetaceae bacterium]
LVQKPEQWQYSGAYHREHGITKIVSLVTDTAWRTDLKLLFESTEAVLLTLLNVLIPCLLFSISDLSPSPFDDTL